MGMRWDLVAAATHSSAMLNVLRAGSFSPERCKFNRLPLRCQLKLQQYPSSDQVARLSAWPSPAASSLTSISGVLLQLLPHLEAAATQSSAPLNVLIRAGQCTASTNFAFNVVVVAASMIFFLVCRNITYNHCLR